MDKGFPARFVFFSGAFFFFQLVFCLPVIADDLSLSATITNPSCGYQNGFIAITAANGVTPYQYSISGSDFQNSNQFGPLPEGVYVIVVMDASAATDTITITLKNTLPAPYLITQSYNDPTGCSGSNGQVQVEGLKGLPPYLYSDDGVHYQTSNLFTNLISGDYVFYLKDANGCIAKDFNLVGVYSCPIFIGGEYSQTACKNEGYINLDVLEYGIPPYSFALNSGPFGASGNFTGLPPGRDTVYVKDSTGLTWERVIDIQKLCIVNLTASATDATCGNKDGTITALGSNGTGPYAYSLNGSNFQNNNIFTGLASGTYEVTIKDADGTSDSLLNVVVNDNCPQATALVTSADCGVMDGSISAQGFKGTGPYAYSLDGINFQVSNIFNNLSAGNYTLSIKDASGFTSTLPVIVTDNCVQATVSVINTTCGAKNGSIYVLGTGGTPPYLNSINGVDFQPDSTFKNLAAGNYTVTIKDANGTIATVSALIADLPGPALLTSTNPASCSNQNGIITVSANGGLGILQYSIDNGQTFQLKNVFQNLDSGLYIVIAKDTNDCIGVQPTELSALPKPLVDLGNDTVLCTGASLLLNATNSNATYQWSDGSNDSSISVTSSGNYSVTVSKNGCTVSGSIDVNFITSPVINIGNDTSICITQDLLLDAFYPQSTFVWQDGSTQPQFKVSQAGVYSVDVQNSCGATKASINVAFENCTCKFYVPNAFTPNHDGKNDIFLPKYVCLFSGYTLRIYNRWGQMIFASNNSSLGWDGNFKGQLQPAGVYVWQLNYTDGLTGKSVFKDGTVILIR